MITTNGHPKAGNHMLVKAVQLLGVPCSVVHIEYAPGAIAGQHVFVKRDPRNIVCSWLRFKGQPVTPGMFITYFRQFDNNKSLVASMAAYEGWLTDPQTLVVRYEDMIATDAEMRRVAAFLNTPYIEGAFAELPGMTMTWYPDHSDYRTIWAPEVDAVWQAEGGPALLARWGY